MTHPSCVYVKQLAPREILSGYKVFEKGFVKLCWESRCWELGSLWSIERFDVCRVMRNCLFVKGRSRIRDIAGKFVEYRAFWSGLIRSREIGLTVNEK